MFVVLMANSHRRDSTQLIL